MPESISDPLYCVSNNPVIYSVDDGSRADIAAASTARVVVARSGRRRSLTHHARCTDRYMSGSTLVDPAKSNATRGKIDAGLDTLNRAAM